MRNLRVSGRPAEVFEGVRGYKVPLPASVTIDYSSYETGDDLAYITNTIVLRPAQARQLAAELLAAAACAEGVEPPAGDTGRLVSAAGGVEQATIGAEDPSVPPEEQRGEEGPAAAQGGAANAPQNRGGSGADDPARQEGLQGVPGRCTCAPAGPADFDCPRHGVVRDPLGAAGVCVRVCSCASSPPSHATWSASCPVHGTAEVRP